MSTEKDMSGKARVDALIWAKQQLGLSTSVRSYKEWADKLDDMRQAIAADLDTLVGSADTYKFRLFLSSAQVWCINCKALKPGYVSFTLDADRPDIHTLAQLPVAALPAFFALATAERTNETPRRLMEDGDG